MKKTFLWLLLTAVCAVYGAEFQVKGRVSAPDLKDVAICDGEKFHPVRADGTFDIRFSYEGTGFIYVDYPSTLKPQGKWSAVLQPGENNVGFTLVKQDEIPETFTFVHGSDVQYDFQKKNQELVNDMAEIANIIKEENARFITFPGDLTESGAPEQLSLLRTEIEKNKMNYFPIYGGHDRIKSKPSYKNFAECFGAPYFGWHFGGIYFFAPASEYMSLPEKYARERQAKWMRNALSRLAPGTPVLVITHQPWYIFDLVEKFAADGKIKLFGFLGAHTHYQNLYEYKGYPVLCVAPLRAHDNGTFTKQLRLVKINPVKGIVATETRLLNQSRRAEPTLCNGDQLLLRIADNAKAESVKITVNGKDTELKQLNEVVWGATLPEKISGRTNAVVTVTSAAGKWQKNIRLANIDKLAWCAVLPDFQRSYPKPAVSGDKLVIGIENGELPSGKGGVAAFDLKTGKQLWTYNGADVTTGVAIDGNTVRALDVNANLLTLDLNSGKLLRSTPVKRNSMYTRTHADIKIAGDKLLAAITSSSSCRLYCFDTATDKMVWQRPVNLGSAWSCVSFTVDNGVVYYVGASMNGAANLADGKILWQRRDASKTSLGEPLVDGDAVYFYLRATLVKLDAKTGKLLWADKKVPGSSSTIGGVCVKDGRFLAFSTNAVVVGDAADGKRIYRRNLQPLHASRGIKYQHLANTAAPKLWKDKLLVLGNDGAVYDMAPHMTKCNNQQDSNRTPFDMIFETGFAFKGSPVIDGDMAYFVGFDGVIYALKY